MELRNPLASHCHHEREIERETEEKSNIPLELSVSRVGMQENNAIGQTQKPLRKPVLSSLLNYSYLRREIHDDENATDGLSFFA